jgi:hypothetical protein
LQVTGYPTVRYFSYGKYQFDYNGGRDEKAFVAFMKDPKVRRLRAAGLRALQLACRHLARAHLCRPPPSAAAAAAAAANTLG